MKIARLALWSMAVAVLGCGQPPLRPVRPASLASSLHELEPALSAPAEMPTAVAPTELGSVVATPEPFAFDGEIAEWTGKPTVVLPGERGAPSRLFVSISSARLLLAGDVFVGSTAGRAATLEDLDVRIGLAFDEPELPPVAFASQWGEQEVAGTSACGTAVDLSSFVGPADQALAACQTWVADAERKRSSIRAAFAQTIEVHGRSASAGPFVADFAGRAVGDRVEFEVMLPSEALPLSARAPLASAKLLLEIGERAKVGAAQSVFAPSLWPTVPFDQPVVFGRYPELLPTLLAAVGVPGESPMYYAPGADVATVTSSWNRPMGYQNFPTEPSPIEETFTLEPKWLGTLANVEIVEMAVAPAVGGAVRTLWAKADGHLTLLAKAHSDTPPTAVVRRGDALFVLYQNKTTRNPLGAGMCGACPLQELALFRVTRDHAEAIVSEALGSDDGDDVELSTSRDLKSLVVRYGEADRSPAQLDGDGTVEVRWLWDERKRSYQRSERRLPTHPGLDRGKARR